MAELPANILRQLKSEQIRWWVSPSAKRMLLSLWPLYIMLVWLVLFALLWDHQSNAMQASLSENDPWWFRFFFSYMADQSWTIWGIAGFVALIILAIGLFGGSTCYVITDKHAVIGSKFSDRLPLYIPLEVIGSTQVSNLKKDGYGDLKILFKEPQPWGNKGRSRNEMSFSCIPEVKKVEMLLLENVIRI